MLIDNTQLSCVRNKMAGVTLIELITFIVVTAVIVVALSAVFRQTMHAFGQPLMESKLVYFAQSQLDSVLSRRFDENSPNDGTPCDLVITCSGLGYESGENANNPNRWDDVDDFNGYTDSPELGYTRTVSVAYSGSNFGIDNSHAKRIDVTVIASNGNQIILTAYKINH